MAAIKSAKSLLRRTAAAALCSLRADKLFRSQPNYRILMYHRIIAPEKAAYPLQPGMYVRPETFSMHCRFFKEHCNVLSLDELVERLLIGELLPPRTIAITFDDGWLDNYHNAFPVLKQHRLPAAFFLATSYIGTERLFWTDEVAAASKNTDLDELIASLFALPAQERVQKIENIKSQAKHPAPRTRQFLNWSEVAEMSAAGFCFGSHSHSHEKSSEVAPRALLSDLQTSYDLLAERGIEASRVFCYPGGYYSQETQKQLADFGIQAAVLAGKSASANTNPRLLPRVGLHEDISFTENLLACRISFSIF